MSFQFKSNILNRVKVSSLIVLFYSITLPSLFADNVDGHYIIATVESSGEGWIGNVKVQNKNFSGSVYNAYYGQRLYLNGYVNSRRKLIFSPRPSNVSTINAKIRKRNKMVIGVSGSYSDVYGDSGTLVGYKRRKL
jgi:hypothetical protein